MRAKARNGAIDLTTEQSQEFPTQSVDDSDMGDVVRLGESRKANGSDVVDEVSKDDIRGRAVAGAYRMDIMQSLTRRKVEPG